MANRSNIESAPLKAYLDKIVREAIAGRVVLPSGFKITELKPRQPNTCTQTFTL